MELAKLVGGLAWVIGLVMLFLAPSLGVIVLIVAVLLSIWTTQKTREKRHQELLDAAKTPRPPEGD